MEKSSKMLAMTTEVDPMVLALQALALREGGVRVIAAKTGSSWQALDQIVKRVALPSGNPRSVGPSLRQKLTRAYPDWLDGANPAAGPATFPMSGRNIKKIWAVGKATGGMPERVWTDNDFPVGELYEYAEEASADPSAFLVEIDNISMLERYSPGEFALVEPSSSVEAGDDVLIRLKSGETMIKRLDTMHNGYRLRSLNGGEQLFFPPEEVSWVYYVAHPVPRRRIKNRH